MVYFYNFRLWHIITIKMRRITETVKIITSPSFDTIRQYETIPFEVLVYYNGEKVEHEMTISVWTDSKILTVFEKDHNTYQYELRSDGINSELQNVYIRVLCSTPLINSIRTMKIKTTSMLG